MDGHVKVRLTRSCELLLAGKIYHMGDELVVDEVQLEQLGDMVLRIDEAAGALEYLARAGFTAEQSEQALPAVLELAAAGSRSLEDMPTLAPTKKTRSKAKQS